MILSHPHPDHFLGLVSVIRAIEVGELVGHRAGRSARTPGRSTRSCSPSRDSAGCGSGARTSSAVVRNLPGGARLRCSLPCPSFLPERGANDNSFVLKLEYGRRSFLLMGDAEEALEHDLAAGHPARNCAPICSRWGTTAAEPRARTLCSLQRGPELATVSTGLRKPLRSPARAGDGTPRSVRSADAPYRSTPVRSRSRPTACALNVSASGHWTGGFTERSIVEDAEARVAFLDAARAAVVRRALGHGGSGLVRTGFGLEARTVYVVDGLRLTGIGNSSPSMAPSALQVKAGSASKQSKTAASSFRSRLTGLRAPLSIPMRTGALVTDVALPRRQLGAKARTERSGAGAGHHQGGVPGLEPGCCPEPGGWS